MLSTAAQVLEREEVARRVGRRLREVVGHQGPAQALLEHVLARQGKMLRAYLVFLTSSLWESFPEAAVLDVAAGVELIHLASLIHDDIVDDGEMRRGQVTVHRAFGVKQAVLLGDYLFASAFSLLANAGARVIDIMGRAIGAMSLGEISQLLQPGRTFQEYWCYIHHKTASLVGACCEAGAVLADRGPQWGAVLRDFGEAVGMAFQLTDDVLDYWGSVHKLGKSVGKDFSAQAWTLPIILAHDRGILDSNWMYMDFSRVQEVLMDSGILSEVWQLAQNCLGRARAVLDLLPTGPAATRLEELLQALAVREA